MALNKYLSLSCILIAQVIYANPRLLVVLNDSSGAGKASWIYREQVEGELLKDFDLTVLKSFQNLYDVPELKNYYGIVAVGGDGTVHRIFNDLERLHLLHIPVAHIPAGSGNALARSIFEQRHREGEVYGIKAMVERIKGRSIRPIDLWRYQTDQGENGVSVLGASFGLAADIDIKSEKLRRTCLSRYRFEIFGGLFSFFWLRNYKGGLIEAHKPSEPMRLIWIMNIPFGSETIKLAPDAKLQDGFLHVMTVRSDKNWLQEKINAIRLLLNLEHQSYQLPYVSVLPRKQILLNIEKNQQVTIDGEPLSLKTTRLEMIHAGIYGHVFSF